MKWSTEAKQRVEDYLREVERHLAHKPESVRKDVVEGLRNQISESVQRLEIIGGVIGPEVIEQILAGMDSPESFAEAALEVAGAAATELAPAAIRSGGGRWFALALAFLAINAYGVWKWTRTLAPPSPAPTAEAEVQPPAPKPIERVLRLRQIGQVDVSAQREVTLKLAFNAAPDRTQLTRFLRLTAEGQGEVKYWLLGGVNAEEAVIETEPVLAEKLEYRLEPGLPAKSEDYQPEDRLREGSLRMEMNLQLREVEAHSPSFEQPYISAEFNAVPDAEKLADYVSIKPAVDFTVEITRWWWETGMRIRGDFRPGTIYDVTFKKGLPAANGSSLAQALTRSVQIPEPRSDVKLDNSGYYLSPRGTLRVPVAAVNLKEYVARLQPVFANNLVPLTLADREQVYFRNDQDLYGEAQALTNRLPAAAPGEIVRTSLDLRALAGGELRGAYALRVEADSDRGEDRIIVVTDLGIAAKLHDGGALVWVNSLRDAQPVAGATVTVLARNNQPLARGETDEQGLLRVEWAQTDTARPCIVVAERDGDLSYINLERTRNYPGEGTSGAAYLADGKLEAAVFTERGIYRPGETVFMQALVRNNQLRAPEAIPVLWLVVQPDGRVYREIPATLDVFGSAQATVSFPEYLKTGRYSIQLTMPGTRTVLGSTTVSLEDFVPPQIRVKVTAPEGRHTAGSVLGSRVRAEHLFGRPAAGLKAEGWAIFTPVEFAPTNWPGWTFGDPERQFDGEEYEQGVQNLDDDGVAEFEAVSRKAWRPPAALQLVQQVTVTEANGRGVTAYDRTLIDPYPFYLGLQPAWEGGAVRVGQTQRVAVVEVQPDGVGVAKGKPVALALGRVSWNSVLRRNDNGRYEWKSEKQTTVIRRDTLAAGGTPQDWTFAVDTAGAYELVATELASGAQTRLSFFAGSPEQEWQAWSREKPGRVELAWDKKTYRPGDTARLQVRAPFAGPALLTVETDRVREARVVMLEKNTAEFEVPVTAALVPNAWCTMTLIRPAQAEAVWSAHRASGVIALVVDPPEPHLAVTVDAPARVLPQTPLQATITVRDHAGQPAQGAVTVMAVDEAICMLTDFATPDPAAEFLRCRGLGVNDYDLYAELMPVTEDAVETVPRAGGGAGAELRRRLNPIKANRFKPLALWQADLPLDGDGRATAQFDLPEFNGEVRLMVVAYNAAQTGATSMPVKVKRDLVVQSALPRFMAIGDRSDAGVVLYNESGAPLTATVRALCGGPLRAENAELTVALPTGGSTNLVVPLVAGPGPGVARFSLEVSGGGEEFRDAIELAVRPASGTRSLSVQRVVAPGEETAFTAPADWLPASVALTGVLSALPSLEMGRALDYVVNYPYGCLEQTVSGAFPLLYAGEWTQRMLPSATAAGDIPGMVDAAIRRVLNMQQNNGGFAVWPFTSAVEEDVSLYATHFLVEAQAAGFTVPADRVQAALNRLKNWLDRSIPAKATPEQMADDLQTRAYICHILARAGQPHEGWNARLREQADQLNFAARAHTASALLLAGEPRQALPLLEQTKLPTSRPHLAGDWRASDIREAALMLSAWLEVDPENEAVARLAQYLRNRQQNGHWGNTQDNAMALLAFGKLARALPVKEQPFAGRFTVADHTQTFGTTNDVQYTSAPGEGGTLTVHNDGPGKMYAWVQFTGVSTEPEPPHTNQLALSREFLDRQGEPLAVNSLPQGDLFVVKITVDPRGQPLDHVVIEDLLPAGWEIENPNLQTAQNLPWLKDKGDKPRHTEARDDRMLIFSGRMQKPATYYYSVRAVTPGEYTLPALTAVAMYDPEISAATASSKVRVVP